MMSEEIKNRMLTIGDLFEFVKKNKIPLTASVFMRPKGNEVFLVNRIGSGDFTTYDDSQTIKGILLDALGADPLKKETIN
jgi:predicted secreted protein